MPCHNFDPRLSLLLVYPTFWARGVGLELLGCEELVLTLSTYICHTTGEGLEDLDKAIRWAKGQSSGVIVGMDGNGRSPWWGSATTLTNLVGELIENLIMEIDLEIVNHPDKPPTFVSNMGHKTWVDLTLGTRSGALSILG